MKQRYSLFALGLLAATVAGCSGGDSAGGDDDPIRIGVLYATSGAGTTSGVPALLGHEMVVEKINAEGGLLGRQVETIHRDTKADPAEAGRLARELVTRYDVDFLIGGLTSSEGQAISDIARQQGIIYISTIPKTTEITNEANFHKYVFLTAANTNTEGRGGARIVADLGSDKVCTILFDYSYGRSLDEPFRQELQKLRPSAQILRQEWPADNTSDYTPYISNLLNAGCEVVFGNMWSSTFPTMAKSAIPLGFFDKVTYVAAGEVGSPEISEQMGAEMPEGMWANSYEVFYSSNSPTHAAYIEELKAKTGKEYTPSFPISGYIGMQFLAEAIREAGTTDTDAVIAALEGLTVETPVGSMTIRESDHTANRGQFWGPMAPSNDPNYPYLIMNPVSYMPADDIMDPVPAN